MTLEESLVLLLVSTAAAILPVVSRYLRLPGTVTEIALGIILGRSVIGLEFGGQWLPFLAYLGFLLLMFHAGMEIDFALLRTQSRGRLLLHLLVFGATVGLSLLFCRMLGFNVFMALVLSTTSLGLVMPTLKEMRLTQKPLGQSILIAATLADFLTLFGITFYLLWNQHGLSWRLAAPAPLLIGFGLLLFLVRLWAWWNPEKAARLLGGQDEQELGVRLALALLFLLVAASELVHMEPVLGAFMGGCVISFVFKDKGLLDTKISALGFGFLIPIFFINIGMQFDLTNVASINQVIFTLKLLGLALAVKIIPSMLFSLSGLAPASSFKVGLLLSTRLSLIVAAAAIGAQQGLLTEETKDAVVLLAVATCLLGPTLFKLSFRGAARQG